MRTTRHANVAKVDGQEQGIFCNSCGRENPPNSAFCMWCGMRVVPLQMEQKQPLHFATDPLHPPFSFVSAFAVVWAAGHGLLWSFVGGLFVLAIFATIGPAPTGDFPVATMSAGAFFIAFLALLFSVLGILHLTAALGAWQRAEWGLSAVAWIQIANIAIYSLISILVSAILIGRHDIPGAAGALPLSLTGAGTSVAVMMYMLRWRRQEY